MPYVPKKAYASKTPEGRARQLANLKQNWGANRPRKMKGDLPSWDMKAYVGNIIRFAEQFVVPESKKPIVLEKWEIDNFLRPVFYGEELPSLALLSLCKKNGKSCLAALCILYKFFCGEPLNEIYVCAHDKDQGNLIIFNKVKIALQFNPMMMVQCKIRNDVIEHVKTGTTIRVLPNDWRGTAGINPGMIVLDELFAFDMESAERFYNELQLGPTRKEPLTLVTSTAGYSQQGLLWELWKKGEKNIKGDPDYNPDYHAFISHDNLASWVTEKWLSKQKKKMRAPLYNRLHRNEWQEGEESFITDELYQDCVDPFLIRQPKRKCLVYVGVDIGLKADCTAIAVVERLEDKINLVDHFIFKPREGEKIDLEDTVETAILGISRQYDIANLLYDPYQFARSAATLEKGGISVQEWPQTSGNTTAMSQNLYSLIRNKNLKFYDDPIIREHLINAQAKEMPRGWRIIKGQKMRKIDFAIALAMACMGAVREEEEESGEFEVFAGSGFRAGYGG